MMYIQHVILHPATIHASVGHAQARLKLLHCVVHHNFVVPGHY